MKLSAYQEKELGASVMEWIRGNVTPEELYPETDLLAYVRVNYNPEDIFNETALSDWAFENGYRRFE